MSPEDALIELLKLKGESDIETAHSEADDILCGVLIGLGYDDLVQAYNDIEKWYA